MPVSTDPDGMLAGCPVLCIQVVASEPKGNQATQGIKRIPVRGPATSTTVLENKKAASAACRLGRLGGFL